MHNVEFKAELRDMAMAHAICRRLETMHIGVLEQTDTYFKVPAGRLKKREVPGEPAEYIFYDRPDRAAPKLSHFAVYTETQAQARFGTRPLPVWLVVRKHRTLHLLRGVRIHLDRVEGLGDFIEFEALVSPEQTAQQCHRRVAGLREQFAPAMGEAISCGYANLLATQAEHA